MTKHVLAQAGICEKTQFQKGNFVVNKQKSSQSLPKVAICLAAFNGKRWIAEQIDSIIAQSGVAVTIYISVDVSSDGTEDWVDAYANDDSRIIVLAHGKNFGGAARNFFRILHEVDFLDFDYVSFADQDDIWLPNKLLRAHEVISTTNADAYSSNVMAFWSNGSQVLIKKSQQQVKWDFLFEAAGPGCTYVFKKELIVRFQYLLNGHFDDVQKVSLHDWLLYAYARANGFHWVIDDRAEMLYRQHDKNQMGINMGLAAISNRFNKVMDGWLLTQSKQIASLVGLGECSFVKLWSDGSIIGLLKLALNAFQCRRRLRDKFAFSLLCLILIFNKKYQK